MYSKKIALTLSVSFLFLGDGITKAQTMSMQDMTGNANKHIYLRMMDTMAINMEHLSSFTSTDVNFLKQMISHHQGAVAMAKYEIENGKNFEMIQLAKSILEEQKIEIQEMILWIQSLTLKETAPPGYENGMSKTMSDMMDHMPENKILLDLDKSFASVMIPHHQAAIDMAGVC